MTVWVLLMITLVPGLPRDVEESTPIYVLVFDSYAKCASQANASNSTRSILKMENKTEFECKEERVH